MSGVTLLAVLRLQTALAAAPCTDVVCVEVEKTRDVVTFYAISRADGVSITFSVTSLTMLPASPPILVRPLSQGRTELMTLRAIPGKQPEFDHGYFWEWTGVLNATHDDRVSYRLPFQPHQKFFLFQGPDGPQTHKGQFAWDFPMPRGTPVCAARARSSSFTKTVRSQPTTTSCAAACAPGSAIASRTGAVIGTSGNSGRSSGPHLHFEVFRTLEPQCRETLPVKFRTADGDGIVLEPGRWYQGVQ